ncbi:hypothetical protein [Endozoicomonas sp. ALB032]|uniref:hypothetical protein n=1 Tax=Endozoicomonas sp. ALB032 TaxID=3403082 RepID=UPI003BB7EE00
MNPVTETNLQLAPALAQIGISDTRESAPKELATHHLKADQSQPSQVEGKSLSERKIDSTNKLLFLDEEHHTEILYANQKCDGTIFFEQIDNPELYAEETLVYWKLKLLPFTLNGVKHYKVPANTPILKEECLVSLPLTEEANIDSCYLNQIKSRLSCLFTKGFENVCKTVFPLENKEIDSHGFCHQLVNYLAFGMDKQKDIKFNGWYEKLPFASIHTDDKTKLCIGDILQLFSNEKLIHSLFYIGGGRCISKHGPIDIFFQSLPAALETYPSESIRIVRLAPEYYSKQIPFRVNY